MNRYRPTVLTVSLNAIASNYRCVRVFTGEQTKHMAVVKADAYGHGMIPVAQRLLHEGAAALAVATVDEGVDLREANILAPVLILGGTCRDGLGEVVHRQLSQAVYDRETLIELEKHAAKENTIAHAHLKIDTGMSRIGVRSEKKLDDLLSYWAQAKHVKMEGIFTHFANAFGDPEFTARQDCLFGEAVAKVHALGYRPLAHAAASEGILAGSQFWRDMVRPGVILYGASVCDRVEGLTPAQTLSTYPVRVEWIEAGDTVGYGRAFRAERPTRVMTLPIGYGDGYPRVLSGRADVLVNGKRAKLLGRVCMDQLMVDVTDIPQADMNSEVVLMGAQQEERITPDELARLADTIPYEIMLGFTSRVTRRVAD